jgi:hypothetical protein
MQYSMRMLGNAIQHPREVLEVSMSASMRNKLFGSKSIESKLVEKIDATKTQVLVRVK